MDYTASSQVTLVLLKNPKVSPFLWVYSVEIIEQKVSSNVNFLCRIGVTFSGLKVGGEMLYGFNCELKEHCKALFSLISSASDFKFPPRAV